MTSLLALPAELRLMIYHYLIGQRCLWLRGLNPRYTINSPKYTPPISSLQKQLLHVCRLMREEAYPIFYSNVRLRYDIGTSSWASPVELKQLNAATTAIFGWGNKAFQMITKLELSWSCIDNTDHRGLEFPREIDPDDFADDGINGNVDRHKREFHFHDRFFLSIIKNLKAVRHIRFLGGIRRKHSLVPDEATMVNLLVGPVLCSIIERTRVEEVLIPRKHLFAPRVEDEKESVDFDGDCLAFINCMLERPCPKRHGGLEDRKVRIAFYPEHAGTEYKTAS